MVDDVIVFPSLPLLRSSAAVAEEAQRLKHGRHTDGQQVAAAGAAGAAFAAGVQKKCKIVIPTFFHISPGRHEKNIKKEEEKKGNGHCKKTCSWIG